MEWRKLMSLIPQVKCRRCGETYSSIRSTCPNCGIRRVTQSGRTPGVTPGTIKGTAAYDRASGNTKWQIVFGLILVVAVLIAVIVMVSTSLDGAEKSKDNVLPTPPTVSSDVPVVITAPTPEPTPTPAVQSVDIMWYTNKYDEYNTATMHIGDEPLDFTANAWPATIENPVYKWSCNNEDCIKLTPSTEDNGKTCTIECIGAVAGGVKVTVECFGVTQTMIIYCLN